MRKEVKKRVRFPFSKLILKSKAIGSNLLPNVLKAPKFLVAPNMDLSYFYCDFNEFYHEKLSNICPKFVSTFKIFKKKLLQNGYEDK